MARNYSNVAVATALASLINNSETSITVGSVTGYPATPFAAIIDPRTPSEEVVDVTNVAGPAWTVTRGVDGTPATSHASGAVVEHGVSARDWREPNDHVSATTSVHGIANTSNLVTLAGSQTLANKTLTSPIVNGGSWASPAFTGGTFTSPTLVTPTIASFVNATHAHTDAASGGALDTGSEQFFFPAPVALDSSASLSGGGDVDVPGLQIAYTAPAAWPTGAKRILYSCIVRIGTNSDFVSLGFTNNGSAVADQVRYTVDNFTSDQAFVCSWPGPLTTTGAAHTVRAVINTSGGGTIFNRALWLQLI